MAKEIRECREAKLDLSHRKLGDEGVAELVPELKVIPFEVLLATAWMFLLHTHLPTYLPPTYLPTKTTSSSICGSASSEANSNNHLLRAKHESFKVTDVPRDGNCLFWCLQRSY